MTLSLLLRSDANFQQITDYLDDLDASARRQETQALEGRDQKILYEMAAEGPPIDFAQIGRASWRERVCNGV